MIDLNIKSALSTGKMSVYRLLKTIETADIKYFSIADKNHALAYKLIDREEHPKLITGTSINTFFKGRPIDLLGYDIDIEVINDWYKENYSIKKVEWIETNRAKSILNMLDKKDYQLVGDYPRYDRLGISIKEIFAELIDKYPDFIYQNERDFRIYGINNPDSEYYIDQTKYLPNIYQVKKLIKKAGGKIFLAHPFEYRSDVGELLQMIIDKDLDGVEVFHASISVLNSLNLIDFCKTSNKMASLGSGFIGKEEFIPLGIRLDDEVLNNECFDWIFHR